MMAMLEPVSLKSSCPDSGYFRKRQLATLKAAEEHGYLVSFNPDLLLANLSVLKTNSKAQSHNFENVKYVDLNKRRIRNIHGIECFTKLVILNLGKNFISFIDSLAPCVQLVKLDIHGNQITQLPESSFWKGLKRLRILYLHDNPVSQFSSINGLAACSSLTILTLFDTPLSLKFHYRHHVVNTIWSLQVLDHYIVSDNEIIEGAKFVGKFAAFSQPFQFDSYPKCLNKTYEDERHLIWSTINRLNYIASHHSPVLIIQRYARGYLLRRALRRILDLQLWAAVTIQRWYKAWKSGKPKYKRMVPPPPTPAISDRPVKTPYTTGRDSMKLDYDTYLKSLRPGSTCFSDRSSMHSRRTKIGAENNKFTTTLKPITANRLSVTINGLIIDVDKLETNISKCLTSHKDEEWGNVSFDYGSESSRANPIQQSTPGGGIRKRINGKYPDQKFTEQKLLPNEITEYMELNFKDDPPCFDFRLNGLKVNVELCDVGKELRNEIEKSAKDVRIMEENRCCELKDVKKPSVKRRNLSEIREKRKQKQDSAIWLACLGAVGKDYKKAECMERKEKQIAQVRMMKEQRDSAKSRIDRDLAERRKSLSFVNEVEQRCISEDLQLLELQRTNTALSYKQARKASAELEKRRRKELTFAHEFVLRTSSCSKATLKFCARELREERHMKNKLYVEEKRVEMTDSHRQLKRFLAERQHATQDLISRERRAINEQLSQIEKDRRVAIRDHVDAIKQTDSMIKDDGRYQRRAFDLPIVSSLSNTEEQLYK